MNSFDSDGLSISFRTLFNGLKARGLCGCCCSRFCLACRRSCLARAYLRKSRAAKSPRDTAIRQPIRIRTWNVKQKWCKMDNSHLEKNLLLKNYLGISIFKSKYPICTFYFEIEKSFIGWYWYQIPITIWVGIKKKK